MEYNRTLLSLAIFLAFSSGLALGYTLGSRSISLPKTINLQNNEPDTTNNTKPVEQEKIQSELTAKEAFAIANQEVLAWAEDSYPLQIALESKKFTPGGRSAGWKFTFYSAKKNKLYEVVIKDGESRQGEENEVSKAPQTLKGEFVDSTILAKTFFSNYPENSEITSLSMHYDDGTKKFIWVIFFSKGSHTLDAEM